MKQACCLIFFSLLAGCAQVAQLPSTMTPMTAAVGTPVTLAMPLQMLLDTGYTRSVKAGSQWLQVGMIAEGTVFKPYRDVFTLEGAHVHEAYLVVRNGVLVGFYLPAERSFSPLKQQITVTFQ